MLVWTDVETTGLSAQHGHLLEVAIIVTDDDLNELASIATLCRPVAIEIDDLKMDDVVREMHTKSGLLDELRACPLRRYEAQQILHAFLQEIESAHGVVEPSTDGRPPKPPLKSVPLAGNTVSFDRAWLREHMPTIEGLFSHRHVDVSTFTEMAKRWAPEIYSKRPGLGPDGKPLSIHRAMPDIRMSIETMKYYRSVGFVGGVK